MTIIYYLSKMVMFILYYLYSNIKQDIKGLVMKQLGVSFGLPVVVSIIVSAIVVAYFLQSVSVEISAYIGIGALITQLSITISILILLLVCYFLSTWILFRRSITE